MRFIRAGRGQGAGRRGQVSECTPRELNSASRDEGGKNVGSTHRQNIAWISNSLQSQTRHLTPVVRNLLLATASPCNLVKRSPRPQGHIVPLERLLLALRLLFACGEDALFVA